MENSKKWSTDEISHIISFSSKVFLFFAIINLLACILGPLLGGIFIFTGVLIYGSWVGFGLCGLFEARRIKARQINDRRFILVNFIELLCWIIWCLLMFRFPYNLLGVTLGGAFFILLKWRGYKSLKDQITAQNMK
jgi:hypothetical protein